MGSNDEVEAVEDADEHLARGKTEEPEFEPAILRRVKLTVRESAIFPGVPLS